MDGVSSRIVYRCDQQGKIFPKIWHFLDNLIKILIPESGFRRIWFIVRSHPKLHNPLNLITWPWHSCTEVLFCRCPTLWSRTRASWWCGWWSWWGSSSGRSQADRQSRWLMSILNMVRISVRMMIMALSWLLARGFVYFTCQISCHTQIWLPKCKRVSLHRPLPQVSDFNMFFAVLFLLFLLLAYIF